MSSCMHNMIGMWKSNAACVSCTCDSQFMPDRFLSERVWMICRYLYVSLLHSCVCSSQLKPDIEMSSKLDLYINATCRYDRYRTYINHIYVNHTYINRTYINHMYINHMYINDTLWHVHECSMDSRSSSFSSLVNNKNILYPPLLQCNMYVCMYGMQVFVCEYLCIVNSKNMF
jgi:hypothetical protein